MLKIAILGLHTDKNLGDQLICKTVIRLYNDYINDEVSWTKVDLRYYHSQFIESNKSRKLKYFFLFLHWLLKKWPFNTFSIFYRMRVVYLSYEMKELIAGADKAIIAGGGVIHYRFHDYCAGICAFILACQRGNIPLIINAVGIEGFDNNNLKCKMFAKYLNYPIIKLISTRDDINTLKKKYLDKRNCTPVFKIADPAIFCSRLFSIKSQICGKIGVGVIRDTVFEDYKIDCKPDVLYKYYSELVLELERRGLEYEFFTNGLAKDLSVMSGVEKLLNRTFNVCVPHNVSELLFIISSYRGIITSRMHSCIVAYSYNRPAITINWNEKIPMWYNVIGKPDCCFDLYKLDPKAIINKFLELEESGYDMIIRKMLEKEHIEVINKAIKLTDN